MSYRRDGFVLSFATGVVGMTFGVLAATSGFTLAQAAAMSAFVFTGASQFAAATVIGGGGTVVAAVSSALFLGIRNAFYGPIVAPLLPRNPIGRALSSHFVIDETTAMATAQDDESDARRAFWFTALWLWSLWNVGTIVGVLVGETIGDPNAWGLDAAFPAAFVALIAPHVRSTAGRIAAGAGAIIAVATVPLLPAGVPIIMAATGVVPGYLIGRARP